MLSRVGATLLEIVQPLIEWADTQVGELEAARAGALRPCGGRGHRRERRGPLTAAAAP